MMEMKKLISALCALMLAVSLAACSRGPAEHGGLLPLDPTDPPATEEPTAAPTNPTQPPEPVELPNAGTLAALAGDGAAPSMPLRSLRCSMPPMLRSGSSAKRRACRNSRLTAM